MDWNRSNSKGAVAPPHSQQYLLPSTSSMVADGQNQLTSVNQHSIIQNISFHPNQSPLLPNLLKAKTGEEFSQAEQAALGNYRSSQTNRPTNQMKQSLHMSSYKPGRETIPIPDNRNSLQNTVGSNYRVPTYVNAVHQTQQQPTSVALEQYSGNGYNTSAVQQPLQNAQLQSYQPTVSLNTYPQQNIVYNSVRPANAIQMSCQQMTTNVPTSNMYNLQNVVAGQYMSSQKLPAETNISTTLQNCRNSQNIASQSLTNCRSNMLPHASQQQMSVPQLQNIQQLEGNANCFNQSQQRQTMQNVLISSASQISAAMPPPTYTMSVNNSTNVFNTSLNQNYNKQRQNYVAPNVQQPAQTVNPSPVQNSITDGQSTVSERTASQRGKQEMLKLLLVYRNFRQKYELLNRENNLLRQRLLQANTSQENAGPPPLLSSLPTTTTQLQASCVVAGQQNVTQAVSVQNATQIPSNFHSQNMLDNVVNAPSQAVIPQSISLQDNATFLKQILKSDNGNHLRQNNYSVLDGQSNVENGSTSALQLRSSETNEVTFRAQPNSGNPYTPSPNSINGNVLKNGQGLHSLDKSASVTQSFTAEKNSYGQSSCNSSSLNGNGQVTTLSREALEASLPLWKTVPQSANGSSETLHNLPTDESPLSAFKLLDGMSGPTNEVSSTIPVQKQDSAVPNPQIAIVSPLVQSKESLYEDYKLSKVHMQSPALENTPINGLINSHESECFSKLLQALESLESDTMNHLETPRPKEPPAAIQDIPDSSLPLNAEVSSQVEVKSSSESIEIIDDSLQISGICTLVEGNTYYNSTIAMMFKSLDNTILPLTDTRNVHSNTEDAICISKTSSRTSPKATPILIKTEPVDEVPVGQSIEGDLHCHKIPSTDTQAAQHMVTNQELCCDPESNAISDQLTELLTEFPYGIKNYTSENILESTNNALDHVKDKPVAIGYKPVEDKAVIDSQSEMLPCPSANLQHVVGMVSKPLMDLKPPAEMLLSEVQQTNEGVHIATKEVNESIPAMDTCVDDDDADDDFEILSNSSVSEIQITLLDQEEISKIFPNEHENVNSGTCTETKQDGFQKYIKTEEPEIELHLLKKEPTDPTENETDKNLFCCLFSWLNLTNKNAPKCNCKQVESSTVEPTQLSNDSFSSLECDSSPQSHELTLPGSSEQNKIRLQIFKPHDRPPKLQLVDSENEEVLQPMDKPPKLEKMVSEADANTKPSQNFTPQAQKGLERSSIENYLLNKDNLIKNPVNHLKSLAPCLGNGEPETPIPGNGEPAFKNEEQTSHKLKSHGSSKSEKLIVKTSFQQSKHPYKERRKSEKNASSFAPWTSKKGGEFPKHSSDGRGKRPQKERAEQNMNTAKVQQFPDQQAGVRSWKKQKSSPAEDLSRHAQGVKKRKEKESHFEKTRKVPSVQEYLERKRELCKKRTEGRTDSRECLGDERHTAERPEISGNPQLDLKRPLSPAKTNVTPKGKNRNFGTKRGPYRKRHLKSESGHRKDKDLHSGQRKMPENKTQNFNLSSSKDKIYLSPCVSSKRASYEGINLAKLQIRHSPDKPKYVERERSLETCQIKPSNSAVKNTDSPKMLEFKLYPEFAHGSPTTQAKTKEVMDPKKKSVVEGIKSSKEAWCNSIPLKKRKVESVEGQGFHKLPISSASSLVYKPIEKNTSRLPQDSQTTFNVFKQMYHEQRSKSLDLSQGNS